MIDLCKSYITTGFPYFEPYCLKGLKASLKCHSKNESCSKYEPSPEGYYPTKEDKNGGTA